jgi:hypothetical protein
MTPYAAKWLAWRWSSWYRWAHSPGAHREGSGKAQEIDRTTVEAGEQAVIWASGTGLHRGAYRPLGGQFRTSYGQKPADACTETAKLAD